MSKALQDAQELSDIQVMKKTVLNKTLFCGVLLLVSGVVYANDAHDGEAIRPDEIKEISSGSAKGHGEYSSYNLPRVVYKGKTCLPILVIQPQIFWGEMDCVYPGPKGESYTCEVKFRSDGSRDVKIYNSSKINREIALKSAPDWSLFKSEYPATEGTQVAQPKKDGITLEHVAANVQRWVTEACDTNPVSPVVSEDLVYKRNYPLANLDCYVEQVQKVNGKKEVYSRVNCFGPGYACMANLDFEPKNPHKISLTLSSQKTKVRALKSGEQAKDWLSPIKEEKTVDANKAKSEVDKWLLANCNR